MYGMDIADTERDKFRIVKQPLWEGYPLPWQLVWPHTSYVRELKCFETGQQALECLNQLLKEI